MCVVTGDTNYFLHPDFIDEDPEAFEVNMSELLMRPRASKVSWWFWPPFGGWWDLLGGVTVVGLMERWPGFWQEAVTGHAVGGVGLAP